MAKKRDYRNLRDPQVVIFLTECYKNEALRRLAWVEKHKDTVEKFAQFKKEPKNHTVDDVQAFLMKEGMAAVTRDFISSGRNRFYTRPNDGEVTGIKAKRLGHSIAEVGLGDPSKDPKLYRNDEDLSCDPIMRPVEKADKELLYQIEPGRELYLKKRVEIPPEKRYYFPEATSWDYGWRQREAQKLRGPEFPVYSHMARMMSGRSGPTPDPDHYKPVQPTAFCLN